MTERTNDKARFALTHYPLPKSAQGKTFSSTRAPATGGSAARFARLSTIAPSACCLAIRGSARPRRSAT